MRTVLLLVGVWYTVSFSGRSWYAQQQCHIIPRFVAVLSGHRALHLQLGSETLTFELEQWMTYPMVESHSESNKVCAEVHEDHRSLYWQSLAIGNYL